MICKFQPTNSLCELFDKSARKSVQVPFGFEPSNKSSKAVGVARASQSADKAERGNRENKTRGCEQEFSHANLSR